MRRLAHLLGLALCAAALAACRDTPSAPPSPQQHVAPAARAGLSGESAPPYACFVSAAMPAGAPYRYRYRKPRLNFPRTALAAGGATTTYRYRMWGASREEPVYVANCVIPATPEAVRIMHRAFGVREKEPAPGEATLLGGPCGSGGCLIEGLEVNACQNGNEWPDCEEAVAAEKPVQRESVPCNPYLGDCGGSGGAGGGDSACVTCGLASATLVCSVNVRRGDWVTCNIDGDSIRSIGPWRWVATDGTAEVNGPSGRQWEGPGVKEGRISVPVTQPGRSDTLRASFAVMGRGWTWAGKGISRFSDGTGTACYSDTPAFGRSNGWNQGLNIVGCPMDGAGNLIDEKLIQPDSEHGTDGFTVSAAVPSGPNQGMFYVTDVTLRLERKSAFNPALNPDAPRRILGGWNLNHCPATPTFANWHEFSQCKGMDIAGYLAALRAHEGYGMNSGRGHYSAALELASRPGNDPMIFFEGAVSRTGETSVTFADRLREGFLDRMQRVEDGARYHIGEGAGIVGGNWTGTRYLWNPATATFELNANFSL